MKFDNFKSISITLFIITILVIACIIIFYLYNLPLPRSAETLGQLGDYIGGILNPFLAFLSFSALLVTILVQLKQLKFSDEQLKRTLEDLNLSRTELSLTRTELKRSADAQTGSKTVMEEQLLTQSLQQFDSTFFAMLKELNSLQNDLNTPVSQDYTKLLSCFRNVMFEDSDNMQLYIEKVLKDREISRYFMLLYQILKIIDTKIDDNIYIKTDKFLTKKMYSNIVRSSIPEELMQLLMINALNNSFQPFKELIEKFNLFEHTSFTINSEYSLLLINAAQQYDAQAFDQSFYLKKLTDCNLFGRYIPHHNIITRATLFNKIYTMLSFEKTLIGPFGERVFNEMNYFCKLSKNEHDDPVGLLLNGRTFKSQQLGVFKHEKFYSSIGIRTIENQHRITLVRSNTGEILIDIIFHDNCEITFEISEMIYEF